MLETYVRRYPGYALLAPVVTAITGSSGSIFVSRISTALHSGRREHYAVTSASLWLMTCPVLMAFLGFAVVTGQLEGKASFVLAYFVAIAAQVRSRLNLSSVCTVLRYEPKLPLTPSRFDPDCARARPGASGLAAPVEAGLRPRWYAHLSPASRDGLARWL